MDWLAAIGTIIGMHMIRKKMWQGFLVALINQIPWLIITFSRELYGFLLIDAVLVYQYSMALMEWRREARRSEAQREAQKNF